MTEYADILVEDIYEAIAKNGFEHLRESWEAEDIENIITGGCVLQQGAMNLGVEVNENTETDDVKERDTLLGVLNKFSVKSKKWKVAEKVYSYKTHKYRNKALKAGDTIMYWNDERDHANHYLGDPCNLNLTHSKKDADKYGWVPSTYKLKTYGEVVEMAYDVLSPYFGETVKLAKRDWVYKRVA